LHVAPSWCLAAVGKLDYGLCGVARARVEPADGGNQVAETAVAVGALAPDVEALDESGRTWRLSEALQRAAQVLVFYRGDW